MAAVLPFETTGSIPILVVAIAGIACTRRDAIGMETSVLVEKDGGITVLGTEDVTTMATVVSSSEKVKGVSTLWGIATGRLMVCLVGSVSLRF